MEQAPIQQIGEIYYCILTALGIPANILTVLVLHFRDCGLSKGTTIYLLAMGMADLLVLIIYVLGTRILVPVFPEVFYRYTLACRLKLIGISAVIDCSVWLTVAFTFDRFVIICCQRFRRWYCTPRSGALLVGLIYLLSYSRNIPYYFTVLPMSANISPQMGCRNNPYIYSAAAWRSFYWIHTILTPLFPYITVALLNLLTVKHILRASRVRQGFKMEGRGDPEMQGRRRAIVLLFSASSSFILLWMSTVGIFIFPQITGQFSYRGFSDPFFVMNEIGRMLRVLNCTTSTCMYALTQSKFRAELRRAVQRGISLIK